MTIIKTQPHLGQRIGATIIDYFFIFVFLFVFATMFGEPDGEGSMTVTGPLALVPILFWFCWLVIPEALGGVTLGHYSTGLKVITMDGNKPVFWQALVRRLFDFVDLFSCFPGLVAFILVQTTKHKQRVGDMIAKTLVVDKNFQMDQSFDFEKSPQNQ